MSRIKVDAHQHFIKPDQVSYGWMTPGSPLARDFLPGELEPWLEKQGIEKTILVQAAEEEKDNRFMFSVAGSCDFVAGVVIWLDLASPGFGSRLETYLDRPKFVGLRPMLECLPDDDWIAGQEVGQALDLIQEKEICFDVLSHPRHLPYVLEVLERFPKLRAVVDHISKPPIKDGRMEPWAELMARVAAHDNVFCKLSGMITEADHQAWGPKDLRPYISHVLDIFGPERLMFGSDWPVCTLAGSYDQVVEALLANLPRLPAGQMDRIFGGTAREFYRI